MNDSDHQSWGRYPPATRQQVRRVNWRHDPLPFHDWMRPVLPFGCGRSYGDSCLNTDGILLNMRGLRRFMAFDASQGILRCEAGTTLKDILDTVTPKGWFLHVTPGTQYVSVGGAIANDVHGKNHHRAGSFGCHVTAFELLRSTGERVLCTPEHHSELFQATIGGLGLTGMIVWAELRLKPISSPDIVTERTRFSSLARFFELAQESDEAWEYTVAWIDAMADHRTSGRGVFIRGNHAPASDRPPSKNPPRRTLAIPFSLPSFALNPGAIALFNRLYFYRHSTAWTRDRCPYDRFFYPLDAVHHWNRLYGPRGLLQYQCVIPSACEQEGIRELLRLIQRSRLGSFLGVLKKFGARLSPGLLSFPRPGTTMALDFPFRGARTLALLDELDHVVQEAGGAVYPAKDARMSGRQFRSSFPQWERFLAHKDPQFSSSFWRRVTNGDSSRPPMDLEDALKSCRHPGDYATTLPG